MSVHLEHKSNPILPFGKFIIRVLTYFLFSFILVVFSLGIGNIGYDYFGGLPIIDSFYNASMILTGMGPVNEMKTDGAKLFSSFYALYSGIAFLGIFAVIFAPIAHRLLHILHLQDT